MYERVKTILLGHIPHCWEWIITSLCRIRTAERACHNSISVSVSLYLLFSSIALFHLPSYLPLVLQCTFCRKKRLQHGSHNRFCRYVVKNLFSQKMWMLHILSDTPHLLLQMLSVSLFQPLLSYSVTDFNRLHIGATRQPLTLCPCQRASLLPPSVGCSALMKAKLRSVKHIKASD